MKTDEHRPGVSLAVEHEGASVVACECDLACGETLEKDDLDERKERKWRKICDKEKEGGKRYKGENLHFAKRKSIYIRFRFLKILQLHSEKKEYKYTPKTITPKI